MSAVEPSSIVSPTPTSTVWRATSFFSRTRMPFDEPRSSMWSSGSKLAESRGFAGTGGVWTWSTAWRREIAGSSMQMSALLERPMMRSPCSGSGYVAYTPSPTTRSRSRLVRT